MYAEHGKTKDQLFVGQTGSERIMQNVLERIASFADNEVLIKQITEKINSKNQDKGTIQKEYQAFKKTLDSIQKKKSKVLTLYEDDLITKQDLSERLGKLNEEKEWIEKRLTPLEELIRNNSIETVSYKLVKQVIQNFVNAYKESLTREQRKRLLHLLIHKITIGEDRKVDTIQIQLNKEVAKHFTYRGGEYSSIADEFSPPFSILLDL